VRADGRFVRFEPLRLVANSRLLSETIYDAGRMIVKYALVGLPGRSAALDSPAVRPGGRAFEAAHCRESCAPAFN